MNCDCCDLEFNLLDCIPYTFHFCFESFCFECIKKVSKGENAKCPKCLEETNKKISELKPNLKMIKMIEKMNNSEKKQRKKGKLICDDHSEKIQFQ